MSVNTSKPDASDPLWCHALEPALVGWVHDYVRNPSPHFVFWENVEKPNQRIWVTAGIEDGRLTIKSAPYKYKKQSEQYTLLMSINDCIQWFVFSIAELDTMTA